MFSNRLSPNRQRTFSDITKPSCQRVFSNTWSPNRHRLFSNKRTPNRHHLFSNLIAPNHQQLFSNKGTPNGSDHLAMLVMSCWRHQAKNKGIRVAYHTPPTKDLLKSQTIALIAMMRGWSKDGYHLGRSNRHYYQNCGMTYVQTITE